MSKSNVVFKLTLQGGPDPIRELQRVFQAAQEDPAGVSWVATRKPGAGFEARPDSKLLAFANDEAGNAVALTARVVSRYGALPADALVRDMYEDYKGTFQAYWKITDVHLKPVSYKELPGTTRKGRQIADAFRGQLSFAYWLPDPPADAPCLENPARPAPVFSAVQRTDSPTRPLHGVDFSGARETGGRNGKIWIASWYPDRDFIELKCGGGDPGFDRIGLASRVIEGGGTWVIDFPFGPPAAVAEAAGWTTWHEYIAWCGSNPDPTALRDNLREVLRRTCVPWPTKREIDRRLGTTWFPFFEQLYRQTITGGRDLLYPLSQASRGSARILPFHKHAAASSELSVVIEGFPGATLKRCGLAATGYKHATSDAEEQRRLIVDSLRERGVPVRDADASTAVHDAEGDAVDALVLLHAARNASRRTAAEWSDKVGVRASMEGWFFD